ncbi:MAG: hypothetical protein KAR21_09655, partial [Spirochaetales bacterium]|nr:hypothetical protein [Spirochaetales bacterium]
VEEREKIYSEIDRVVASNKLRIKENTFSFAPVSSDIKLPVLINIGAFILIVVLSVVFYFLFNQAETNIVSEKETVLSAEGMLIQAIREESEQKLGEKEKEISNIQGRLDGMRQEQQKLLSDSEEQARLMELELKEKFKEELEAERLKLQSEGLSSTSIEQKLHEFEASRQKTLEDQIELMKRKLEEARLERENSLNELITGYEQNLESARTDRSELEEKLKEEFSEKEQLLEDERNTAVTQLARLDKQQKEEKLVIDQILSMYTGTNELIKNNQYEDAIDNLDNLEELLNQENIMSLPAIQYRREVDFFMIRSLRKLVENEKQVDKVDTGSLIESANLIASVSGLVEEGNRYFEEGDLEAARESY